MRVREAAQGGGGEGYKMVMGMKKEIVSVVSLGTQVQLAKGGNKRGEVGSRMFLLALVNPTTS